MVVTSEQSFDGPVIDATFRITSTRPGELTLEAETFKPDDLRGRIYGAAPFPEGKFTATPTGFSRLEDAFNEVANVIIEQTGVPRAALMGIGAQNPAEEILGRFSNIGSETFEVPEGTATPVSKTITYPPIRVPLVGDLTEDDVRDAYFNLPRKPSITMSITPTNAFERLVEPGASVEFEIPASAIIEPIRVDADCSDLFPDLASTVSENVTAAERAVGEIRSSVSTVDDVRSALEREAGSEIGSITIDSLGSMGQQRVSSIRNKIRSVDLENVVNIPGRGEASVEEAITNLNELDDRVEDEVRLPRCKREFTSSIDDARSVLESVRGDVVDARETKQNILEALEGFEGVSCDGLIPSGLGGRVDRFNDRVGNLSVQSSSLSDVRSLLSDGRGLINEIEGMDIGAGCDDILLADVENSMGELRSIQNRMEQLPGRDDIPTTPDLDCGDVAGSLRAEVSSIENQASNFRRAAAQERTEQRRDELISRVEDAIDDVDSDVDSANPCKGKLKSRLRRARGDVRNVLIEEPEPEACFDLYPDLDDRVSDVEGRVAGINGRISGREFQQFADSAEDIINDIQDEIPPGNKCRRRYIQRIESSLNRAQSLVRNSRGEVIIEMPRDGDDTRNRIRELRRRLNEIVEAQG